VSLTDEIAKIATIDLFKKDPASGLVDTGVFVGRPFHLDYSSALLLIADAWKQKAQGLPQGCLLLAYYENEPRSEHGVVTEVGQDTVTVRWHLKQDERRGRAGTPVGKLFEDPTTLTSDTPCPHCSIS